MGKTVRYKMVVNTFETIGLAVPISQKVFDQQIRHYKKIIKDNHTCYKDEIEELKQRNPKYWQYPDIEGCMDDIKVETKDKGLYIETVYSVYDNGTAIIFWEEKCKPEYCFRKT